MELNKLTNVKLNKLRNSVSRMEWGLINKIYVLVNREEYRRFEKIFNICSKYPNAFPYLIDEDFDISSLNFNDFVITIGMCDYNHKHLELAPDDFVLKHYIENGVYIESRNDLYIKLQFILKSILGNTTIDFDHYEYYGMLSDKMDVCAFYGTGDSAYSAVCDSLKKIDIENNTAVVIVEGEYSIFEMEKINNLLRSKLSDFSFQYIDSKNKNSKCMILSGKNRILKYSISELEEIHKHSSNNAKEIFESNKCGCFYCNKIFDSKEVFGQLRMLADSKDYDLMVMTNRYEYNPDYPYDTVRCPKCEIDSIIGDKYIILDEELLCALNEYFF